MNKREFVSSACALGLSGWPALAALAAPGATPADVQGAEAWRRQLGRRFELGPRGATRTVTLAAVRPGRRAPGHEQFTLVFDGEATRVAEALQPLHGRDGGRVDLFVEPTHTAGRVIAQFSLLG